jgi:hypothetical protein
MSKRSLPREVVVNQTVTIPDIDAFDSKTILNAISSCNDNDEHNTSITFDPTMNMDTLQYLVDLHVDNKQCVKTNTCVLKELIEMCAFLDAKPSTLNIATAIANVMAVTDLSTMTNVLLDGDN